MRVNKSRLSYRIFLIVLSVLSAFILSGGYIAYTLTNITLTEELNSDLTNTLASVEAIIRTGADLSVRNYLHSVTDQDVKILGDLHDRSVRQGISAADVQQEARRLLLAERIGSSGYVYVLDSLGNVVVHPENGLVGQSVRNFPFVREQIARKSGFLEYSWKNPSENDERRKTLYMQYFAPWDWIVSASAYRDELDQLVYPEELKKEILAIWLPGNGYPFVLGKDGEILVHPYLQGNAFRLATEDGLQMRKMVDSGKGRVIYVGIGKDGRKIRKEVLFTTVEKFGWVIGAATSVADFYAPLQRLRNTFMFLLGLGMLSCTVVSLPGQARLQRMAGIRRDSISAGPWPTTSWSTGCRKGGRRDRGGPARFHGAAVFGFCLLGKLQVRRKNGRSLWTWRMKDLNLLRMSIPGRNRPNRLNRAVSIDRLRPGSLP